VISEKAESKQQEIYNIAEIREETSSHLSQIYNSRENVPSKRESENILKE